MNHLYGRIKHYNAMLVAHHITLGIVVGSTFTLLMLTITIRVIGYHAFIIAALFLLPILASFVCTALRERCAVLFDKLFSCSER